MSPAGGHERTTLGELRGGWKTLIASMLGFSVGSGLYPVYVIPTVGVGLESTFGWTRTEASSLVSALFLGSVVGLPVAGWLIDKVSPRPPALFSLAMVPLLLALAAVAPPEPLVWQAGAFLLGFLGAGALSPAFAKAICLDFVRARGLAMGLTLGAVGLSGAIFAPLLQELIARFGLQRSFLIVAAVYVAVFLPLVFLLLPGRRPPVAAPRETGAGDGGASAPLPYTALVLLGVVTVLIAISANSSAAHLVPLMKDAHAVSPAAASSVMALAVMASRPVAGFLMDRLPAAWVGAAAFLAAAVGMGLISHDGASFGILGAMLIGLAVGAEADVVAYLASQYVPAERYGRVYTWLYVAMILTTAVGPLVVAVLHDRMGGYSAPFAILCACAIGSAVLLLVMPRPRKEAADPVGSLAEPSHEPAR